MNPNEMMLLSRKYARIAAKLKKASRAHFEAVKAEWEAKEILKSMNPEVKSRTVNLNEVW